MLDVHIPQGSREYPKTRVVLRGGSAIGGGPLQATDCVNGIFQARHVQHSRLFGGAATGGQSHGKVLPSAFVNNINQ